MRRTTRTAVYWTSLAAVALLGWPTGALAKKTVLRLRLDGPVTEAPDDAANLQALLQKTDTSTLHQWVCVVRDAAADSDIDGLVLIVESPEMNWAQLEEMSQALQTFRAAGKPVYCYLDYGGNLSYALAANADHITIAEYSMLATVGLRAELWFFKGLLEKIGVEPDMLHCGAYKAAIEPYSRTEPSPEAAENVNWLLDSLYGRWVETIAAARGLSASEVKALVDQAPLTAEQARDAGLVDEVSSFPAFKKRIYKEFGKDVAIIKRYERDGGVEIDFENPFAIFELFQMITAGVTEERKPGVGLIYIDGAIMVGKSDSGPFGSTAGSTSLRAAFEEARLDDEIRAVVVRVSSPGGSALASDIIWEAATRCGEEKPLIVSMGGVAGSGGYYVSLPGDTIFADASTITGSIGVAGGKFVLRDLLHDKLGITTTAFQRGRHAGLMSLSEKWTEQERDWMINLMDSVYDQFKQRVITSRGDRLREELEDIAAGRVFTGEQALKLGLIDKVGGLTDALDYAAEKAGLGKDYEVQLVPEPSKFGVVMELLQQALGDEGEDEFEIAMSARLRSDPLMRAALPLLQELAPEQAREFMRNLRNLLILQREQVGCFMPAVPQVR